MKQFSKKLSLAAASALGCVALFGCGSSDSNNTTSATDSTFDSDVEAVNLCGDYTTYEDGLGNTYCMDLATGAVVYSVMADGTIVYQASTRYGQGRSTRSIDRSAVLCQTVCHASTIFNLH